MTVSANYIIRVDYCLMHLDNVLIPSYCDKTANLVNVRYHPAANPLVYGLRYYKSMKYCAVIVSRFYIVLKLWRTTI